MALNAETSITIITTKRGDNHNNIIKCINFKLFKKHLVIKHNRNKLLFSSILQYTDLHLLQ